jgi:hypothetical protein
MSRTVTTTAAPAPAKKAEPKKVRRGKHELHLQDLLVRFMDAPTSIHHMTRLVWAMVDFELHARLKEIAEQEVLSAQYQNEQIASGQGEIEAEDFPFPADGCVLESIPLQSDAPEGNAVHD